jgi:hypothetical protein
MSDYIFYQPVGIPDSGVIEAMLDWAKANCPSFITNDYLRMGDGDFYRLYFGQEQDFAWFQLRWS